MRYTNAAYEDSENSNSSRLEEIQNSFEWESESIALVNTPIHAQLKSNIFHL